jgi:hypothetical protein
MSELNVTTKTLPTFKYVFNDDVSQEIINFWDENGSEGAMMVAQPVMRGSIVILKCQMLPKAQADVMTGVHTSLKRLAIHELEGGE